MATTTPGQREPISPPAGGLDQPTDTHKYQSKNGLWYDEYQKMVNANIADNKNHLRKLGLLDLDKSSRTKLLMLADVDGSASDLRKRSVKSRKVSSAVAAAVEPVRRSSRKRNVEPENSGLTEADFIASLQQQRLKKKNSISATKRIVSCGKSDYVSYFSLTEEQRTELSKIPRERWVEDMREYLLHDEGLSASNCASVMRQVIKLASGVGVTYGRWPDGVAFGRRRRIDMGANFDEMLDGAVDFENEHGADLGNGTEKQRPALEQWQHPS
jgi:hypothetical protein